MKILIVRHGEPDYAHDTLTEKGWKEAELLASRLSQLDIKDFYVSPLGRAKDTASLTLKKMGRKAKTCDWLKEFPSRIHRPDHEGVDCAWDWMPEDWTTRPQFYDVEHWYEDSIMKEGQVKETYLNVTEQFDALLKEHGYVRKGNVYEVIHGNHDTIVLFCHFGVECVLLSRLLNVSPMILWHGFVAAPSSVTTICSEERKEGTASFRISAFGDTSHLYAGQEEPSFMARYCECYGDKTMH